MATRTTWLATQLNLGIGHDRGTPTPTVRTYLGVFFTKDMSHFDKICRLQFSTTSPGPAVFLV
jgi:hypothetical protein